VSTYFDIILLYSFHLQVQAKSLPDCIKERLLSSFYRTGNSDPHSIGLRSLDWTGLYSPSGRASSNLAFYQGFG